MTEDGQWSCWKGSPHLLLPQVALTLWRAGEGSSRPTDEAEPAYYVGPADYDRVCAVAGLIGAINVGPHQALVLGDEVPMSTLTQHSDGSLVIFVPMTWYREGAFAFSGLPAIVQAVTDQFTDSGIRFVHPGGAVFLQPAAFAGDDVVRGVNRITRLLAPGQYAVWTVDTTSDEGEFRAHWLRRL
jgi:hypothetical protein